jgi:hypothetical protein
MSKERKLLGRWHNGDLLPEEYMALMKETRELLAQPEQDNIQYLLDQVARLTAENAMLKEKWSTPKPEQEPMAWVWGVFNPHTGDWCDGCVAKDKPLENQNRRNIRALYTAPPRREPLSEDKLDVLAEANITDEGIAGYYLGFRDAEKHHGIGGGE